MDEQGIAFIQQLRELRHGGEQAFMHVAFGIVAVWHGEPNPLQARVLGFVADALRKLTFLQQGHHMRATGLAQEFEIPATGAVVERQSPIADFDEVIFTHR